MAVGFEIAKAEPGLALVPVVAAALQIALAGVAAGLALALPGGLSPALIAVVLVGLLMVVSVGAHATLITRVMARLHGERITNRAALKLVLPHAPQLLAWSALNALVLSLVRGVASRGIAGVLLRGGWNVMTFFTVPVILFEGRTTTASMQRSVALCRQRWGEDVTGVSLLGLVGTSAALVVAGVSLLVGIVVPILGVGLALVGLAVVGIVMMVASAAFNSALYWFAVTGRVPERFAAADLQAAYRSE